MGDAATWNPRGATGYRYNDEAGMPFAYHFSRAYTFLHPLLSEESHGMNNPRRKLVLTGTQQSTRSFKLFIKLTVRRWSFWTARE